jgi:hypothetical protein
MLQRHRPQTKDIRPPPSSNGGGFAEADLMGSMPGRAMQRVQSEHITAIAVQVPRDIEQVTKDVLEEATLAGDEFFYSWTVDTKDGKKKTVEGVSVDGAMTLLRNWGNASVTLKIVDEGPQHWVFEAMFIDFEKGFTVPRLFRQRKEGAVAGKYDDGRKTDIAFQIGQSKAERNAIEKGIPAWLAKKAMAAAKLTSEKQFEDLPKALAGLRRVAKKWQVTDEQIEAWVGFKLAELVPADHVQLAAVFRALDAGETSVEQEFPRTAPAAAAEPAKPAEEPKPAAAEKPAAPAKGDPKAEPAKAAPSAKHDDPEDFDR